MEQVRTPLVIASFSIAVLLIGGSFFFVSKNNHVVDSTAKLASVISNLQSGKINEKYQFSVNLGEVGSEHSHASFQFFIDGELFDFAKPEYMVRSPYVHIENMDGVTIHKHATGINLPLFFATLDIRINKNCFMLDITKEYCGDESKQLTLMINGEVLDDIYREISDGDRVLINYGNDSDKELMEKFDTVPEPVSAERR